MTSFFVEFINAYINGEDYYYTESVFFLFAYYSYCSIESVIDLISPHEITVQMTFMEEGNIMKLIIYFDDPVEFDDLVEFNNFTNSDKFINNELFITTFVDVTFITYLLETLFINENSFSQPDLPFSFTGEDYFLTNANGDKLYYSKGKIVKLVLKSGFVLIVKQS